MPRSPQLTAQVVTLKPSSPSDCPSSDESSGIDSVLSGSKPKRRVKAQASRGDAVLIGFLGGLNHPDLANRAGEEVLPQSESESDAGEMVLNGSEYNNDDASSRNSSPDARSSAFRSISPAREDSGRLLNSLHPRKAPLRLPTPERLTPHGNSFMQFPTSAPQDRSTRDTDSRQHGSILPLPSAPGWAGQNVHAITAGPALEREQSPARAFTHSPTPPTQSMLSEAASTNVLAAMHVNPPGGMPNSPNQREELPSLRETGLKPLLDDRAPQIVSRSPAPTTSSTSMLSPPVSSNLGGFPSPSSQSGGSCSPHFPVRHLSPAYSGLSAPESGPSTASTHASLPVISSPSSNHIIPGPMRRDSHQSNNEGGGSHSADRRLPLLVAQALPPSSGGGFKCTFEGCKAPPFQTQYLLQ